MMSRTTNNQLCAAALSLGRWALYIAMSDEDTFYRTALREIESNNRDEATWAWALAQGNGSRDAAVSTYIGFELNSNKHAHATSNEKLAKPNDTVPTRRVDICSVRGLLICGVALYTTFTFIHLPQRRLCRLRSSSVFVYLGLAFWAWLRSPEGALTPNSKEN